MIADTCFMIDFLKGNAEAMQKALELKNQGIKILITSVTIFEIWKGIIHSKKTVDEIKQIYINMGDEIAIQLDAKSARIAGLIHGKLHSKGINIDEEDAMIAGIALNRKETVLTKNKKHFSRIPNLKIETY